MRRNLISLSALGISNVFGKLLWAASLAIAMRYLEPQAYGVLVTLWSAAGMLAAGTDLGIGQLLLREGVRQPAAAPALLRHAFLLKSVVSAATVAFVCMLSLYGALDFGIGVIPLAIVFSAPLLDHFFTLATVLAQIRHRLPVLALWRVVTFACIFLGILAAVRHDTGMTGISLAWSAATLAGLCGLGWHLRERSRRASSNVPGLSGTHRLALPFLAINLLALAYGRLDVLVLGTLGSPEFAGHYHAAYQVILLVYFVPELLFTVAYPALYQCHGNVAALSSAWRVITRWQAALALALAPVLLVFGTDIMALIGGKNFLAAGPILSVLALMVMTLPASSALHFLVLTDNAALRMRIETGIICSSSVAIAVFAFGRQPVMAAASAALLYSVGCLYAWCRLGGLGFRLPLLIVPWRVLAAAFAAFWLLWLPLPWWLCALFYMLCLTSAMFLLRFIDLRELDHLSTGSPA